MLNKSWGFDVLLVLAAISIVGCGGGLPPNFADLPLEAKIDSYGKYLDAHINPEESARLSIASHGGMAADRLSEYLTGKRSGFPYSEAMEIIQTIQERQCSLGATAVPSALKEFIARDPGTQADYTSARVTLDEIERPSDLPACR